MIELAVEVQSCFDRASNGGPSSNGLLLLGRMLECQEAQNWLALADYLEYELVQLMTDSCPFKAFSLLPVPASPRCPVTGISLTSFFRCLVAAKPLFYGGWQRDGKYFSKIP